MDQPANPAEISETTKAAISNPTAARIATRQLANTHKLGKGSVLILTWLTPLAAQNRRLSAGFSREWPFGHRAATRSALDGFRPTPDNCQAG